MSFFLSSDSELDHSAARVERFDDFILVVAGEDESAVTSKLLNKCPKEELYVVPRVICLINDDDFMFSI
jgi:hypothetical protein